mmetsp:Transcript_27200/g.56659  ORF Transcript_27200/g.56659 Transcript_27200/m.56659 type:complete len:433 (+) Transcript_27200:72-1370(+)
MTPLPLLHQSPLKNDDRMSEISSECSDAEKGSIDVLAFDPDAVDFEPLLVSGTGKILNYHSASYYEDENSISVSSSAKTPVATNGNVAIRQNALLRSMRRTSRMLKPLSLLLLAVFCMGGALSLFAIDSNGYGDGFQTTVVKNVASVGGYGGSEYGGSGMGGSSSSSNLNNNNNGIVEQHMMNADIAAFQASTSNVVFWEPYLDHNEPGGTTPASASTLVENSMEIMSQCFDRSIYTFNADDVTGTFRLHQTHQASPIQAIFTPNFQQTALGVFSNQPPGAFVVILHDPVNVYLDRRKRKGLEETVDNILVRQLAGIGTGSIVTDEDYNVATQVLRSKFVVGTCEESAESLRRFLKMVGGNNFIGDTDQCARERHGWNEKCQKIKENDQALSGKKSKRNLQMAKDIRGKHLYDIMLYEMSKGLFREQSVWFE